MGNATSSATRSSRRSHPQPPTTPPPPPPPTVASSYTYTAATPFSGPYPNPAQGVYYHQYHPAPAGYFPPYRQHHPATNWAPYGGRYPCGPPATHMPPFVEHQKALTIRNEINVKKESIRVEPDEGNSGKFLVSFIFDATVPGSITIIYFAKEGEDCMLTSMKESLLPPVTVNFEQGLGQKFSQPSGTGINFSMFEESDLLRKGDVDVCPLAIKADACPVSQLETGSDGNPVPGSTNSQITQAVFDKDREEYKVKVLKQILWVNGKRYELQEIYGIGNSLEGEFDGNDPGKECVICLSEPRDTTVLPCRHMCMCSGCAKLLRFQTNRCPICRQPVERLLEIEVSNGNNDEANSN